MKPENWERLDTVAALEEMRKYYCTGPCGQSQTQLARRAATSQLIKRAIFELNVLREAMERDSVIPIKIGTLEASEADIKAGRVIDIEDCIKEINGFDEHGSYKSLR